MEEGRLKQKICRRRTSCHVSIQFQCEGHMCCVWSRRRRRFSDDNKTMTSFCLFDVWSNKSQVADDLEFKGRGHGNYKS